MTRCLYRRIRGLYRRTGGLYGEGIPRLVPALRHGCEQAEQVGEAGSVRADHEGFRARGGAGFQHGHQQARPRGLGQIVHGLGVHDNGLL